MVDRIDQENERILAARESDDLAIRKSVAGRRPTGDATKQRIRATLRAALNAVPSTGGVPLLINPAKHLQLASGASGPARRWTNARVADWQERFDKAAGNWRARAAGSATGEGSPCTAMRRCDRRQ